MMPKTLIDIYPFDELHRQLHSAGDVFPPALAAVAYLDGLSEALQAIEDGEGDAQVIARQTLQRLGIATLEEGR